MRGQPIGGKGVTEESGCLCRRFFRSASATGDAGWIPLFSSEAETEKVILIGTAGLPSFRPGFADLRGAEV